MSWSTETEPERLFFNPFNQSGYPIQGLAFDLLAIHSEKSYSISGFIKTFCI